jgi:hypothetical protein
VLISQFNLSDPGKGMEKFINDGNNLLMLVKSTASIMASSVIKAAKKIADKLTATTGTIGLPSITARAEAQEEANQLNLTNQSVIGAKKGVVKAITKLVGSNVTNAILRMADGSNHKNIDKFTLYKVMKSAIDGANQPSTNDALEQLLEVINRNFNFCKKVSVNMELMQLNAAQMAMYGIVIGIHRSHSRCWPISRWPPNPIMAANFAWPCMPSARSTRTTTCMTHLSSRTF